MPSESFTSTTTTTAAAAGPLGALASESEQAAVENVLRRAEISRLTRNLKSRLALATFKTQRGLQNYDLSSLEPQFSAAQAPSPSRDAPVPALTPLDASVGTKLGLADAMNHTQPLLRRSSSSSNGSNQRSAQAPVQAQTQAQGQGQGRRSRSGSTASHSSQQSPVETGRSPSMDAGKDGRAGGFFGGVSEAQASPRRPWSQGSTQGSISSMRSQFPRLASPAQGSMGPPRTTYGTSPKRLFTSHNEGSASQMRTGRSPLKNTTSASSLGAGAGLGLAADPGKSMSSRKRAKTLDNSSRNPFSRGMANSASMPGLNNLAAGLDSEDNHSAEHDGYANRLHYQESQAYGQAPPYGGHPHDHQSQHQGHNHNHQMNHRHSMPHNHSQNGHSHMQQPLHPGRSFNSFPDPSADPRAEAEPRTPPPPGARDDQGPRTPGARTGQGNGQGHDRDGANLLMFLATSPGPGRTPRTPRTPDFNFNDYMNFYTPSPSVNRVQHMTPSSIARARQRLTFEQA